MNLENARKISDAAPSVFYITSGGDATDVPFLFECGDGWVDILLEAATQLNDHIQTLPDDVRQDVVVLQVKEKYGTLRIYVSYYTEEIDNIVKEAEKKSCKTCETCGKEGKLRGSRWFYTACDKHTREEDLQKMSPKELP